jgi:LacI family transcriptional regulator
MATIYEVSEAAGVSLATVSRVVNGNSNVSQKTRDKVLSAMESLGYQPNTIAQSLASKRSNSVGILVSELHGSFFGNMMSAVELELRESGKHAIITAGHADEEKEKQGIEFLLSRRCDALILHVEAVSDEYLIELDKKKIPFVIINHKIEQLSDRCFYLDNEEAGYIAAKAVIEHGHKDIAYITGPALKEDAQLRLAGHKRAFDEAGIAMKDSLLVEGDYKQEGGVEGLRTLLNQKESFTALICANDEMASGAMSEAREQGMELPSELSIIGFDDVIFSEYMYPGLTTINNPVTTMGRMAARWVLKNVYDKKISEIQNKFDPKLVVRDSLATIV